MSSHSPTPPRAQAESRARNNVERLYPQSKADDTRAQHRTTAYDATWLSQCIRSGGKKASPLPILANALIGVRAVWPDAIACDEMFCAPMLMRSLTGENDFT